jgi:hypothetical protein
VNRDPTHLAASRWRSDRRHPLSRMAKGNQRWFGYVDAILPISKRCKIWGMAAWRPPNRAVTKIPHIAKGHESSRCNRTYGTSHTRWPRRRRLALWWLGTMGTVQVSGKRHRPLRDQSGPSESHRAAPHPHPLSACRTGGSSLPTWAALGGPGRHVAKAPLSRTDIHIASDVEHNPNPPPPCLRLIVLGGSLVFLSFLSGHGRL